MKQAKSILTKNARFEAIGAQWHSAPSMVKISLCSAARKVGAVCLLHCIRVPVRHYIAALSNCCNCRGAKICAPRRLIVQQPFPTLTTTIYGLVAITGHLLNRSGLHIDFKREMSELESQFVKRGQWINHAHGRVKGDTITTDSQTGATIIALLAVITSLGLTHLWHLLTFAHHQLRADGNTHDGFFRQQQALLRYEISHPPSVLGHLSYY